jgi:pimeloyl-ACP methyl ester carboxylesterase
MSGTAVTLNGRAMTYDDRGESVDVMVLVHGHPFNRSMWAPQVAALTSAGWRTIVPDLRGYGDSEVVPGVTTLETFARDIEALIDHLGVARVVLGGLSMGGQIVMECARLFPERLRGIVLAATFPQADTEEGKQRRRAMAARLRAEGMDGYATEVLSKMLAPRSMAALPAVAADVLAMMRATAPDGAAAALLGRAERPPYDPVLAGVRVPALVVVGDEDAFTSRADAELMHRLLTASDLVWMEGVGHMPNLERPDAFNAALIAFAERVRRTSS